MPEYYRTDNDTNAKIVIACTNPDGCVTAHGDIWCIVGENGHVCRYLQLWIEREE